MQNRLQVPGIPAPVKAYACRCPLLCVLHASLSISRSYGSRWIRKSPKLQFLLIAKHALCRLADCIYRTEADIAARLRSFKPTKLTRHDSSMGC